jgi:hypothetical protein
MPETYGRFAGWSSSTATGWSPHGRNTVDPKIQTATVDEEALRVSYRDGRELSVPIAFYWRLADATKEQLQNFEISPSGRGIHWPEIDEDLSAQGLLDGSPAPRPASHPRLSTQAVADALGVGTRALQKTMRAMRKAGISAGSGQGTTVVYSDEDLKTIRQWRMEHPRGRPRAVPA